MSIPAFSFTTRVTPVVQIGIGSSTTPGGSSEWGSALWGDPGSVWAGIEPQWIDVTCHGYEIWIDEGRRRNADQFEVGRAEISLYNVAGWGDLTADDDPGLLTMRPGRPVRVGVLHADLGPCWLYRGYIDVPVAEYDAEAGNSLFLSCVDALGEVGRAKLPPSETVVGDADTVSGRMARILSTQNWPSALRAIDNSPIALLGSVLQGQVIDLLRQGAASGNGHVFGDHLGRVRFRAEDWQAFGTEDPVDATIGNVEEGDLCPSSWRQSFDRADMATQVTLDRQMPPGEDPAEPREYTNVAGRNQYGVEPHQRLDLWTEQTGALDRFGARILATRGPDTLPRTPAVVLDAARGDAVIDVMSSIDIFDAPSRYRCRLQQPWGTVFDVEQFAVGVRHELTPDFWHVEISLDDAAPFAYGVDAARWGTALFGVDVWASLV